MRKGTHHSPETIKKIKEKRRIQGEEGRITPTFKKGNKPWNKDLKGLHLSKKSEWKKGEITMEKHPQWKGKQKISNDCIYIETEPYKRERRPRLVYKKEHGKIKSGYVIYHIDGNRYNDNLDNLIAITRAELMKINSNRSAIILLQKGRKG